MKKPKITAKKQTGLDPCFECKCNKPELKTSGEHSYVQCPKCKTRTMCYRKQTQAIEVWNKMV